ncbi:tetratricopeptide repeat protein [Kiritimatiellota bacterium B12222]|nr:tetratricopeptide repeat protein [Kiritimatiellota bacterium B12222]
MKFWVPFVGVCLCTLSLFSGEAEDWLAQLGAETFEEREAASQRLWEMDIQAMDVLVIGAQSEDPEIRRRSQELLKFFSAGVSPEWPQELQQKVIDSDGASQEVLTDLMKELLAYDEPSALPFLVRQLRGPAKSTAKKHLDLMVQQEVYQPRFMQQLPHPPQNKLETDLWYQVYQNKGSFSAVKAALALPYLSPSDQQKLVQEGVKVLQRLHRDKKFADLLTEAKALSALYPDFPPYIYQEGLATWHLGDEEGAKVYCDYALSLYPENETAHYQVAEMLQESGHRYLAAREWAVVVTVAPHGGLHDVNAYFHLADYHQKMERYDEAAEAYEHAMMGIRQLNDRGLSGTLNGGSEADLLQRIQELRSKALKKQMGEDAVALRCGIAVKEGRFDELREMTDLTGAQMTLEVKPFGLRLLEIVPSTLVYLAEKEKLVLMVKGEVVGEKVDYVWEEGTKDGRNWVLVKALDMRYIFELNPETLRGELIDQFELEYTCYLILNERMKDLAEGSITVNDESFSVEELPQGIPFDYLPEEMNIQYSGIRDDGMELNVTLTIDPRKRAPDFP